MTLYGIYFSDGELYFGWLQEEHGNGRSEPMKFDEDDLERARSQTKVEELADPKTVFRVLPISATEKQIEAVHNEAIDRTIERMEKKLKALKKLRGCT